MEGCIKFQTVQGKQVFVCHARDVSTKCGGRPITVACFQQCSNCDSHDNNAFDLLQMCLAIASHTTGHWMLYNATASHLRAHSGDQQESYMDWPATRISSTVWVGTAQQISLWGALHGDRISIPVLILAVYVLCSVVYRMANERVPQKMLKVRNKRKTTSTFLLFELQTGITSYTAPACI